MRKTGLLALMAVLAVTALPVDDASARSRRENQGSGMYNPEDNPFYAPTPDEFNAQEYRRRRAANLCYSAFECAGTGRTGYTPRERVPYGYVPLPNRAFLYRYPDAVRVPGGAVRPVYRY